MTFWEAVYLIIWVLASAGLAVWFRRKWAAFRQARGFAGILALALASGILHNVWFGWLGREDVFFFLAAIAALGIGLALFAVWLVNLISDWRRSRNDN